MKRNGRPKESALGYSQKIVAEWWKWVGEKTKTGDSYQTAQETDEKKKNKSGVDGSYWTAQVNHGDGGRKKRKTEEDGS